MVNGTNRHWKWTKNSKYNLKFHLIWNLGTKNFTGSQLKETQGLSTWSDDKFSSHKLCTKVTPKAHGMDQGWAHWIFKMAANTTSCYKISMDYVSKKIKGRKIKLLSCNLSSIWLYTQYTPFAIDFALELQITHNTT